MTLKKIALIMFACLLFVLTGCDEESKTSQPQDPDTPTKGEVEYETVTDLELDAERKYTGQVIDGIPNGKGTLTWVLTNCVYVGEFVDGLYEGEGTFYWHEHGDTLVATWDNGYPVTGKYTYSNTMSYTGEFNTNWQFHGTGSFDWNTYNPDGSVKAWGWLYEGEFKNGSPAGCKGRITFTDARINPNSEGIHWFEGELDGFPSIRRNQSCKGKIIFSDKSIYEGDLLYDLSGNWHRYGEGIQYFYTSSNYNGASVGGDIDDLLYCYKGQFDAINHMYIYGNGVMYISDKDLNPVAYIKGCWDATTRTANWLDNLGEWSDDMLLPGYENVEEIEFVHGYYATLQGLVNRYKDTDLSNKTLLIGHSHFTMWYENAAIDMAPEYDAINFGIGGSNAYFWDTNIELLSGLKNDPKHILVHMYGNIAEGDKAATQTYYQSVITKLHAMFPTTEIVCVSAFNTVNDFGTWRVEYANYTNGIMKEWVESNDIENDRFIDVNNFVFIEGATSGQYYVLGKGYLRTDIWLSDNLHLNAAGHKLFAKAIKDAMGGNSSTPEVPPTVDPEETYVVDMQIGDDRKYTGEVINGVPNGSGTLTWVNTNCVYEGEFLNGVYHGEGKFSWLNSGDTLQGTFENGAPTYGKYTYANTMSYTGEFNSSWVFHGEGTFDWNQYNPDGRVKAYGWLLEGEFRNGTPDGCHAKITFIRSNPLGEGVHWFEGIVQGFPGVKLNQTGKGKIVFGDKSIYEGDIYYSATGEWQRKGIGVQDFSNCNFPGNNAGGTDTSKILRYEGEFDHAVTGWMYGNGIMYFVDEQGRPAYYIKAFFSGVAAIKEYSGNLELYEGFDESMERPYLFNYPYMQNYINNKYPQNQTYDAIICGDSYTDMMHASFNIMNFDTAFAGYDVIDTGIGGTTYYEWIQLAEYLIIPYAPKKVVLHLGYNDLHMGLSAEDTLAQAKKLVALLQEKIPGVEVILMTVEPSPTFASYLAEETKYNNLLKEYCSLNDIELIDHAALLLNAGQPVSNIWNYFIGDGVHLNAAGYERFVSLIKEKL